MVTLQSAVCYRLGTTNHVTPCYGSMYHILYHGILYLEYCTLDSTGHVYVIGLSLYSIQICPERIPSPIGGNDPPTHKPIHLHHTGTHNHGYIDRRVF